MKKYVFILILLFISTLAYSASMPSQGGSGNTWGTELRTFFSSWFDLSTGASSTIATQSDLANKQDIITVDGGLLSFSSPTITLDNINLSTQVTGSLPNENLVPIEDGYISSASYWSAKQEALTPGVDYLAPDGSAASLTNFPVIPITSGGTGTTGAGWQVGDILVITSLTPTTVGVLSAPTTTNCVYGKNGSGTLSCYTSLALNAPFITGTGTPPTDEGFAYWNTSTDVLTVGTGAATKTMIRKGNIDLDAIDFADIVSTGSNTLDVYVPWAGTITSSNIFCQATSTISAAIYTAPTNTDVFTLISASAPVAMSGAKYEAPDTTLTGWTTSFSAGTYFRVVSNGMTGGPCSIGLGVTKTN